MLIQLPTPLLAATLLLLSYASAKFTNDFSGYPSNSRPCLLSADADSGCDGDTVPLMNACLCSNTGDFLANSAQCIGKQAKDELHQTYNLLKINCDGSKTPMDMTEPEFIALGEKGADSTTSSTPTPTPTDPSKPTNTDDPDNGGGGLGTGATIGIAVGATAIGVGLIAGLIFFFMRRRRQARNNREESNPMLNPGGGPSAAHSSLAASTVYSGRDSGMTAYVPTPSPGYHDQQGLGLGKTGSPAWGPDSFAGPQSPPAMHQTHPQGWGDQSRPTSWAPQSQQWSPPQPQPQSASWGSPPNAYQNVGPVGGAMPNPHMPPSQEGGGVYELASAQQTNPPVELSGSHP
ncbi:uncharacterized protein DNG_07511 [Cephalotrichum gorgonifer]|uniref:Extracellular membrane protein CFEM domain-containing protein n=1 Tax=Cephalotrichum gorgonifer TaxID=2041049 RepID=A0AAE8N1S1_9PEZI|nr:uncharacterized protein DNG_07511 [Cephalotrichum gorgonifer]